MAANKTDIFSFKLWNQDFIKNLILFCHQFMGMNGNLKAAEAAEQFCLDFSESGARTGNHVVKAGIVNRNAVHLAFHQDCIIELPNGLLGEMQVKEYA